MSEFSPWTLFTDVGIISLLLLLGKLIRVKVQLAQRYFIPPSLMAGFMGLVFGPGGLDWLPLSNNMGIWLFAFRFGEQEQQKREPCETNVDLLANRYAMAVGVRRISGHQHP